MQAAIPIKANLYTTKSKEKVFIHGLTGKPIMVIGQTTV